MIVPPTSDSVEILSSAQLADYIERLGLATLEAPTGEWLAELQLAHLRNVSFENLDIYIGKPIRLDDDTICQKVLNHGRGGYCYELNSLFARLLRTLGYSVALISARTILASGSPGRNFGHLAILVTVPGAVSPTLVDVGFGDAFIRPIPLTDGHQHLEPGKRVRVRRENGNWRYEENAGNGWKTRYTFESIARELADFKAMNEWYQTSPDSHLTTRRLCTVLTLGGRLTLSGTDLIMTPFGDRTTTRALCECQVGQELRDRFGIRWA